MIVEVALWISWKVEWSFLHGKISWFKSSHWTLLTPHLFHFSASKWGLFVLKHLVWWKLASQAVSWKFQNFQNVFALLTRSFFLLDYNNSSATNIQLLVFTVQLHYTWLELFDTHRFGDPWTWWWGEWWNVSSIWNGISSVPHMLSPYY